MRDYKVSAAHTVQRSHAEPSICFEHDLAGGSTLYSPRLQNFGIKVFSATKARDREMLGEVITDWIRGHPTYEVFDKIVTQSSDSEFHCIAITVFYWTSRS